VTHARGVGGSFVRIVHETLDSLTAPDVRDELIQNALRMATPSELPNDAQGYARFVRGPLYAVMLHKLGAELTDSISAELEHVLRISSAPSAPEDPSCIEVILPKLAALPVRRAPDVEAFTAPPSSHVPPSSSPGARPQLAGAPIAALNLNKVPSSNYREPVTEAYPDSAECLSSERPSSQDYERGVSNALGMAARAPVEAAPRVFVASQSQTFVHGLAHFLEPQAIQVDDVMELLKALGEAPEARSVIVLDCRRPSIRPIALAALADELPPNVQVVLWGASKGLRYQLARLSPSASSWLNCSEDDDLQSVALCCESLVG